MKTGIERIKEERQRQIDKEGWDARHDESHTPGTLASAAMCYEIAGDLVAMHGKSFVACPSSWPWELMWWKPVIDDAARNYEKAGALFLAEANARTQGRNRDFSKVHFMELEAERVARKIDNLSRQLLVVKGWSP